VGVEKKKEGKHRGEKLQISGGEGTLNFLGLHGSSSYDIVFWGTDKDLGGVVDGGGAFPAQGARDWGASLSGTLKKRDRRGLFKRVMKT